MFFTDFVIFKEIFVILDIWFCYFQREICVLQISKDCNPFASSAQYSSGSCFQDVDSCFEDEDLPLSTEIVRILRSWSETQRQN